MKITEVSVLTLHNRETGEEVIKTYKSRVEVRDVHSRKVGLKWKTK